MWHHQYARSPRGTAGGKTGKVDNRVSAPREFESIEDLHLSLLGDSLDHGLTEPVSLSIK